MGLAAIERSHLVSTAECITDLIRPGKTGPAKNEDVQRFHGFLSKQGCRSCAERKCAGCGEFNEMASGSAHCGNFLVIPSEVEESLAVRFRGVGNIQNFSASLDMTNITRRE